MLDYRKLTDAELWTAYHNSDLSAGAELELRGWPLEVDCPEQDGYHTHA